MRFFFGWVFFQPFEKSSSSTLSFLLARLLRGSSSRAGDPRRFNIRAPMLRKS